MKFDGKEIVYTRASAAQLDKQFPPLSSLSVGGLVAKNGLKGLDGVDVALIHGKRSVFLDGDDWVETKTNKKDFTHGNVNIICEGNTEEQIDKNYRRLVGEDTWKTNKGDTILHFTGEVSEIHDSDNHIEQPYEFFEHEHDGFGWGIARADAWILNYNLLVTYSTSFFKYNADFRLIDSAFKMALSEHVMTHFADEEANVEVKGTDNKIAVVKSDVKPASVEIGGVEGHEIGLTQNIATTGFNSNI